MFYKKLMIFISSLIIALFILWSLSNIFLIVDTIWKGYFICVEFIKYIIELTINSYEARQMYLKELEKIKQ